MKISPPPMAFLEYVFVPIHSIVSNSLWPHVFSLLGSCVHEFSRQEYRNGLPFPPPGDPPNSGIKPLSLASPAWAGQPFTSQSVSSVAQLCPTLCDTMDCSMPGFPVHHQFLELAQTCPLSRWCHPTISSSVVPFSSCLQSFPASRSFPMSQFFASGGQIIRVSASASVLSINIQDWFPLGLTSLISLQSRELSRVFSNARVQKHQFFRAQFSF